MRQPNELPASLKMIDVAAILRKRGIYAAQDKNLALRDAFAPVARQIISDRKKPKAKLVEPRRHQQLTNEEVMAYWEKQIHVVDIIETKFDNKVQQFIGKMVDGFLKNLESEIATTKNYKNKDKDYFSDNEDELLATAQLDFTPLLMEQAVYAGTEAYRLIKSNDIYLTTGKLHDLISANVKKFTESMLDTDRDTLIKILSDGLQAGTSIPEIRSQITADFENIQKTQAQRITRTEVLRASIQAQRDAFTESGVVEGLQWLTAGAEDECADYEGEIRSIDDGGGFYDIQNDFQDGDPPLHPNCRCVLLPVLIGEKAYVPQPNKGMHDKIVELESQIDKRTKEFKELKAQRIDDQAYIKSLEKYLGVSDEPSRKD